MTAFNLAGDSKTPPPKSDPPSRPPKTPPPPTKPPKQEADSAFDLALSLGEDVAWVYKPPARRDPETVPVVSAVATTGGPVLKPQLPQPLGPPRFGEATAPHPKPTGPTGPVPHPPPPVMSAQYDVPRSLWLSLSLDCPAWPSSRRPTP